MQEFFYPNSVAVIGVSSKPENLGRNIVGNLVEYGFCGIVYAVGPRGGIIETRRIYRSVTDIPDHVDLAVILTPASTVPGILDECGQKGIRWAIIETAGFREYTEEGRQLEEEIDRVAKRYGIRFTGPNCIGVINMENGFCVPFPRLKKFVKQGDVSVVTQSGGVGMSVLNLMANEGLGLDKFVSVGNMQDISAEDMLEYLIQDENTALIFVYLESIHNGRRLMEVARQSTKPVLIFKANIGKLGQNIALSHTASLTSDDTVVDAAFHQAGILRIHDATSLAGGLKILRLPPMKGKNLAIISRSGGHAVLAADACELSGFDLAYFPEEFLREIEKHFRASVIRLTNPLDLGDLFDLDVYAQIVEQTLQLEGVDGVVFLHTALSEAENQISRLLLERLIALTERYNKPVAYYLSTTAQEISYLKQSYNFPIFTQVVETVRALEMSHYYYCQSQKVHASRQLSSFDVDRPAVRRLLAQAGNEKRDLLLSEALSVLQAYGISQAPGAVVQSAAEAVLAADQVGYPVVLKIVAGAVSHKSDAGGVQLNLKDAQAVEVAYKDMLERIETAYPQAQVAGVLVQPMVVGGSELILGGRQDPQFGAVVLIGLGGIFVEIIQEVVVRVAPITQADALEMLEELRGGQVLQGARGQARADIDAVVAALLRLSQLLSDFPEIKELDINPLRIFGEGQGCQALDARIILAKN
jgi:acyl-CoA synthetase (NDP forming)